MPTVFRVRGSVRDSRVRTGPVIGRSGFSGLRESRSKRGAETTTADDRDAIERSMRKLPAKVRKLIEEAG